MSQVNRYAEASVNNSIFSRNSACKNDEGSQFSANYHALAARVPPYWHILHIDEEAEKLDWNIAADVIGITFHTPSAYHAYTLAAHFRSRGICVVMGGPHVTLMPGEASQHADAVFIGEAEGLWEESLKGFNGG